jgi:hypothetical protein
MGGQKIDRWTLYFQQGISFFVGADRIYEVFSPLHCSNYERQRYRPLQLSSYPGTDSQVLIFKPSAFRAIQSDAEVPLSRTDIIYIVFLTSMKNIKAITGVSSVAGIFIIAVAFSILLSVATTTGVTAQNLTANVSNAIGNVSAPQPANQTAERGENVSLALIKTLNQTSEVGQNMSNTVGNASKSSNQTITTRGNNAGSMNSTGTSNNSSNLSGNTSLVGSAQQLSSVLGNNSCYQIDKI